MHIVFDSVVNFTGDAIVNAANEGCLGGGGIDGEINYRGGELLCEARAQLPVVLDFPWGKIRCHPGNAVMTIAGALPCKFVIHAVGPRFGHGREEGAHATELDILKNAYINAIRRAEEEGLKSVGFCLLSAGIFRGSCPLKQVIEVGLDAITEYASSLDKIFFCAFTVEEKTVLREIVAEKKDLVH